MRAGRACPSASVKTFVLAIVLCALLPTAATAGAVRPATVVGAAPTSGIALTVDRTGLYKVTGTFLRRHRLTWPASTGAQLALTAGGKPVARVVSTNGRLTDASFIEFYGLALDTRYTTGNVYMLSANARDVRTPANQPAKPGAGTSPDSYSARFVETRRRVYQPAAPGDGWFFTELESTGGSTSTTAHFALPDLATAGAARVTLRVWGVTEIAGTGPQHHVVVSLNGHALGELKFSGTVFRTLRRDVPVTWLRASRNALRMTLPGDVHNQYNIDVVDVQTFAVVYPHQLTLHGGTLTGHLTARPRVVVNGPRSGAIDVWRVDGGEAVLTGVAVSRVNGGLSAAFSTGVAGTYAVVEESSMLRPRAAYALHNTGYLLRGAAALLVIAPAQLLPALAPLIAYHESHGLSVKTVDVADVYTRFSAGVLDPGAIRAYIAAAGRALGVQSVLLVGGDTYDPHGYLGCSARSCPANPTDRVYVPSLYVRNDAYGSIPSDEQYVDGGHGPVLGIGRIPAVTPGQVSTVVSKTLAAIAHAPAHPHAVLAAGREEADFAASSDALAALLPASYTADRVYESQIGAAAARKRLFDDLASNPTLVDYIGHGSLEQWGNPPALLTVDDVAHLPSAAAPALFLGWGCQTAYYVDPTDQALNARLLFRADAGAVAAIGSTGLDLAQPQEELATAFYTELFHDPSVHAVGQALQIAEDKALAHDPSTLPPVQSYELFGDPALPVSVFGRSS